MSVIMSDEKRVKMNIDIDPALRDAIYRRCSKLAVARRRRNIPAWEFLDEVLRPLLADELTEIESGDEPPPDPPKKRGRPKQP